MTQARDSCEEGTSIEKLPPPYWPVAKPTFNFLYK